MSVHPMIPVPQALRAVLTETASMLAHRGSGSDTCDQIQTETISMHNLKNDDSSLVGRISAERIHASEVGYPPYNASIMDGYAIDAEAISSLIAGYEDIDYDGEGEDEDEHTFHFHILDRVYAGPAKDQSLSSEEPMDIEMVEYLESLPNAIYVTTGAVIPSPFTAVIPVEQVDETDVDDKIVSINLATLVSVKRNAWIRPIGCDIKPFSKIIDQGEVIESVHIGLMIQCDVKELKVTQLPSVGILSTGNELISHHDQSDVDSSTQATGVIPDANGPVLMNLLASYGTCRPFHLGIIKDDEEERLTEVLQDSMRKYDVIITSGGISMGDMDIIEKVLVDNLGCTVHFGRLHMKPGKPTTFLTVDVDGKRCLIFALPGNPVSSIVCSELLVRPCLDMIHNTVSIESIPKMVQNATVHPEVKATLLQDVKLDFVRPEYHRVKLKSEFNGDGIIFNATSTGVQRSSRLASMRAADGMMLLPKGQKGGKSTARAGETYPVILLRRPFGNTGIFGGTKVKDSIHLGNAANLTVGIIEVVESMPIDDEFDLISQRIEDVLGSSTERHVTIEKLTSDLKSVPDKLRRMNTCVDVIFVIGTHDNFVAHTNLTNQLRKMIHKEAVPMASLLRQGSAINDPSSAIFDTVVGITHYNKSPSLLIGMSYKGLEGGLDFAKGLLRKTLSTARGN